jgi:2-(1,2-epoxy-1,2-dihydrophenyl)acetyl-CoA isomerase
MTTASETDTKAVLFEIEDSLARITLNRPEAYNSIDHDLASQLIEALDACAENKEVRAIILTGAGKAFCAGQDLKEVMDPDRMPGFERLLEDRYAAIVNRLRTIEKPFVAAVNGIAAGAGANFALACDIIVASEKASFAQVFSAISLIPDSGGTFTLPRAIGHAKASALAMLGDKVSAEEAERIGMIYKYFPLESFEEEVTKIGRRLAAMPTKGLGLTKRAFNEGQRNSFAEQIKVETRLQIEASQTYDYNEGVTAFVEKRKPVFRGE